MELRVLKYFVEIAREGNMTRAADNIHITQPTLSKQIKDLENELGKKLFKRESSGLTLTDEGMLLRKRAEDILSMVQKTEDELRELDNITGGEVYIGCAESYLIKNLAAVINNFRKKYPLFKYNIMSAGTTQSLINIDQGLLDFAVIVEPPDLSKYNYLEMPGYDTFGLLMKENHPLAQKEEITIEDLKGEPLMCSAQSLKNDIPRWCGKQLEELNIIGTVNLFYNGTIFVKEGICSFLVFEHLAYAGKGSGFVFRPLSPALKIKMYIVWKKYQVFTPIAEKFLEELKSGLEGK